MGDPLIYSDNVFTFQKALSCLLLIALGAAMWAAKLSTVQDALEEILDGFAQAVDKALALLSVGVLVSLLRSMVTSKRLEFDPREGQMRQREWLCGCYPRKCEETEFDDIKEVFIQRTLKSERQVLYDIGLHIDGEGGGNTILTPKQFFHVRVWDDGSGKHMQIPKDLLTKAIAISNMVGCWGSVTCHDVKVSRGGLGRSEQRTQYPLVEGGDMRSDQTPLLSA
ncbi:unnamed protein product [Vitrella brassicaformis CCMP3155]|uniref:Uncharacterized protein n=1 Tax=Vitrella brassicaformis (strain CCMP3155) TaxID=1169540 RepID=A0A0G4FNN9_VITBC|nr:unnamed protein product [Vitrella brassicaformis CCMP3155]|eukprot:CEM15835.1 unnamed protein product [Vitrella brassicaformis CCMP3155]